MQQQLSELKRDIARLQGHQQESVRLLKAAKSQCGMMLGEEIESHLAMLTGGHFNAREYHYERPNGEQ